MTKTKLAVLALAFVGLLAAASVVNDVVRHRHIPVCPDTTKGPKINVHDDLVDAQQGRPVDWSNLEGTLAQLEDFRMAPLIRIVYRHSDKIDAANLAKIHAAIFSLRYWMDQPGEDGH